MARNRFLAVVAGVALSLSMASCAMATKPVSVESVSGTYLLYPDAKEEADSLLEAAGGAMLPDVSLDLNPDGTGRLLMESEGKGEEKSLRWRLDGGSRNPEILLTLTDAISPKDKWVAFLMMLESDPSHTKIRGSVSEGEIRIRQSDADGGGGTVSFVFSKVADGTAGESE